MKTHLILLALLTLSACTNTHYEGRFGTIDRMEFGTDTTIKKLKVSDDPSGPIIIELEDGSKNETDALRAAVEAAITAAMKGAKP